MHPDIYFIYSLVYSGNMLAFAHFMKLCSFLKGSLSFCILSGISTVFKATYEIFDFDSKQMEM